MGRAEREECEVAGHAGKRDATRKWRWTLMEMRSSLLSSFCFQSGTPAQEIMPPEIRVGLSISISVT